MRQSLFQLKNLSSCMIGSGFPILCMKQYFFSLLYHIVLLNSLFLLLCLAQSR